MVLFIEFPSEYWQDEQDLAPYYQDEDNNMVQEKEAELPFIELQTTAESNLVMESAVAKTSVIDLIEQSNMLIYDVVSTTFRVARRVLAEFLGQDIYDDDDSSSFDYLRSTMNMAPILEMQRESRLEEENKTKRIEVRIALITEDYLFLIYLYICNELELLQIKK
ncbi:hypothetical protein BpHYR1_053335, partial [Brachionus plicatilis]